MEQMKYVIPNLATHPSVPRSPGQPSSVSSASWQSPGLVWQTLVRKEYLVMMSDSHHSCQSVTLSCLRSHQDWESRRVSEPEVIGLSQDRTEPEAGSCSHGQAETTIYS